MLCTAVGLEKVLARGPVGAFGTDLFSGLLAFGCLGAVGGTFGATCSFESKRPRKFPEIARGPDGTLAGKGLSTTIDDVRCSVMGSPGFQLDS